MLTNSKTVTNLYFLKSCKIANFEKLDYNCKINVKAFTSCFKIEGFKFSYSSPKVF